MRIGDGTLVRRLRVRQAARRMLASDLLDGGQRETLELILDDNVAADTAAEQINFARLPNERNWEGFFSALVNAFLTALPGIITLLQTIFGLAGALPIKELDDGQQTTL